jgi:hypothetical protein
VHQDASAHVAVLLQLHCVPGSKSGGSFIATLTSVLRVVLPIVGRFLSLIPRCG